MAARSRRCAKARRSYRACTSCRSVVS
jgi:hypothetical protein